jgi:hypothetical protein
LKEEIGGNATRRYGAATVPRFFRETHWVVRYVSAMRTTFVCLGCGWLFITNLWAGPDTPARVEVSLTQSAAANPPVGCNEFGDPGGTAFSAGNLIPDAGFEPMSIRRHWRVVAAGMENGHPWAEVDRGGISDWDLTTTGFLNDAEVRLYRLVDALGQPLPQDPASNYLNLTNAARYVLVGTAKVPGAGDPDLPLGGWLNTVYTIPGAVWGTRANRDFTDARWVENGRTYYYIVTAIGDHTADPSGLNESDPSLAPEISATPQVGLGGSPHIYVANSSDGFNELGRADAGGWFQFQPGVAGATGAVIWQLLDENNLPLTPPAGLSFNSSTGELVGSPTNTPAATRLRFRATTTNGVASRDFILNNPAWTPTGGSTRPQPPTGVTATAGDGFVYLAWNASPTPGVVGYRVYRAEVPRSQQRQRVYFNTGAPQPLKDDYVHFAKRILVAAPAWSHLRVRTGKVGETWRADSSTAITLQRVAHTGGWPSAFRFPGETCLQVTIPHAGAQEIGGPYIFYPATGGEGQWYSQLEPGRTYRYEAWMRQTGLGNSGQVRLGLGSFYSSIGQTFAVTGDWRLVGFTFTAPPRATNSASHSCPTIRFTGPGTLWLDNLRLFRADTAADLTATFTPPSPLVFEELLASQPVRGEKGLLRSMGVLLHQATMASALSFHRDAGLTMNWYQSAAAAPNMTVPLFLQYALRTGATPATRMKPWLNLSSHLREEEWLMLVEYLGAPINPDDPADVAAKPWAFLRYQQRGVVTPWTDEFSRIYLEFANETWHNGAVSDEWFGWGRSYWVHGGAQEFGLAADYFTTYVTTHSPWWDSLNTAGRLRFVMGSNYQDYGEKAAQGAPLAHAVAHTTYVGPKWEVGETPLATYDDHGIQATLLGHVADTEQLFVNYRRQREQLAVAGHTMDLLGYEGGPSGYALPGQDNPTQHEYSERYGKSLAMGVAALDAWLSAHEYGFSDQAYLGFSIGDYWSSHTQIADGYRPHAGWLAMTLRNRFASGRMLRTAVVQSPTITWDGSEYSLVSSYSFRDGRRLCVFLLSRKLGGFHDGTDWGDGSTPVTLVLPANPTGPATLYRLSGDPRASNREALNVTIQQTNTTLTRETTVTLPPGSIYLYVVDTDLSDRDDPLPAPTAPTVTYAATGTTLTWPTVVGATGYTLYRSTRPYFNRNEVTETFASATNSFTDDGAVGGTTYYYRLATDNGWGTGFWSLVAIGGQNPIAPVLPAPNLHSLGEATSSLVAAWDEVPGATGYRVGLGAKPGGPYLWSDTGIALNWTFAGLSNGVPYYATVHAYSNHARGPNSRERSGTPLAAGQTAVLAAWEGSVLVYSGHLDHPPLTLPASRHLLALNASELVRGPGVRLQTNNYGFNPGTGPDGGCHYDGKFVFEPATDGANFGATGGGSLSNAIARGLYVGCTIIPATGQAIALQGLDTGFQYSFGSHPLQAVLRYRIGTGDWHELTSPGYSVTPGYWLYNDVSLALTGEAALQSVREPLELRFHLYSTGPDARWHPAELVRSVGEDLILRGTCQTVGVPGRVGGLRSVAGRHQVTLSWIPVAGAESYTVRWGTFPGGPYTGSQSGLTQVMATIGGLSGGVPCYFTVEAVNALGPGLASPESSAVPLTSFEAWRNVMFTLEQIASGQADDAADPDGDGWRNLLEYAFASDPLQAASTPVVTTRLAGSPKRLSLSLPLWAEKDDLTVVVEASDDLIAWTPLARSTAGGSMLPLAIGVTVNSTGLSPATVTVLDLPAEATAVSRFIRLSVGRP